MDGIVNLPLVFLIWMEPAGSQGTGMFTVDGEEQLKVSPGSESDFPGKHGKTRKDTGFSWPEGR